MKILMFINRVFSFIATHKLVIIIPILLVILAVIILGIVFRKKIYKYMADAEAGAITAKSLSISISKLQDSDLDERMVLVIAKIITSFPILKLLPQKWVVSFLNTLVQRMFNSVKALLDAKAEAVLKKDSETNVKIETMVNEFVDNMLEVAKKTIPDHNTALLLVGEMLYNEDIAKKLDVDTNTYMTLVNDKIGEVKDLYEDIDNTVKAIVEDIPEVNELPIPKLIVDTEEPNVDALASMFIK